MLFELQAHRGARAVRPGNTLPALEAALDAGVSSVETDIHLTRDGIPVIAHDPAIRRVGSHATSSDRVLISALTLAQLRAIPTGADLDRDGSLPRDPQASPVARDFAATQGIDPFAVPTLEEWCGLAAAYAGETGRKCGKPDGLRQRAGLVGFDLELKRLPYRRASIDDEFDGSAPALLERRVVEIVRARGLIERTRVRSFDHRAVLRTRELEPKLQRAVLIAGMAPVCPAALVHAAGASVYCPDYLFLDAPQVAACHKEGIRVIPWTVNEPEDWACLFSWGVDGMTTDDPLRLAEWLRRRGLSWR